MRMLVMILTASIYIASPVLAQKGESYNPGRTNQATPAQSEPIDYQTRARKHFASWTEKKVACYEKAGLENGKHFRINPDNKFGIDIDRRVWLISSFNHGAIAACKALKVE